MTLFTAQEAPRLALKTLDWVVGVHGWHVMGRLKARRSVARQLQAVLVIINQVVCAGATPAKHEGPFCTQVPLIARLLK